MKPLRAMTYDNEKDRKDLGTPMGSVQTSLAQGKVKSDVVTITTERTGYTQNTGHTSSQRTKIGVMDSIIEESEFGPNSNDKDRKSEIEIPKNSTNLDLILRKRLENIDLQM